MNKKDVLDWITAIIVTAVLIANVAMVIKCWDIPLAERSGYCALLH
jgi:hypothetical protein